MSTPGVVMTAYVTNCQQFELWRTFTTNGDRLATTLTLVYKQ